jgi:hypothetical protein
LRGSFSFVSGGDFRELEWAVQGARFAVSYETAAIIAAADPPRIVETLPFSEPMRVAGLSPDGKSAILFSASGAFYLWNEGSGVKKADVPPTGGWAQRAEWSESGDRIVVQRRSAETLLITREGRLIVLRKSERNPAFADSGRRLVTQWGDRLEVTNAITGDLEWALTDVHAVDVQGNRLAVAFGNPKDERPFAVIALALGLLSALLTGFKAKHAPLPARFNEGIRLSLRNALIASATAGTVMAALKALIPIPDYLRPAFSTPYAAVLAGCLFGALDVLQHLVLRLLLWISGQAPVRYESCLEEGVRLAFLRRVGGGYLFVHRLLLEHFRDRNSPRN